MKINRPHSELSVGQVIKGMTKFRKVYNVQIWLEVLFCRRVNDSKRKLLLMEEAINWIQSDKIHLNRVVRPPSEEWAIPLNQGEMEKIRAFFGERASIV